MLAAGLWFSGRQPNADGEVDTMAKRTSRSGNDRNNHHLRTLLAQEAARLICDHGIEDYWAAKYKAAEKMGFSTFGALPNNREIESAVAERQRIFGADQLQDLLTQIRLVAAEVMHELQAFNPYLVGQVLSGNITEHSAIKLHLFSDTPEAVGTHLSSSGFKPNCTTQKLRIQRERSELFPAYQFYVEDFSVDTAILPEKRRKHAPLSPLDGRPMKRARLREVAGLADSPNRHLIPA